MDDFKFYDVTLRDGNHALRHQLQSEFVTNYCEIAEKSGAWAVEVGHGNGLGASSYLVGKSSEDDKSLLAAARNSLKDVKLAVHVIPGFATIEKDLIPAIDIGVDVFRVATHVTETDTSQMHIEFLKNKGKIVQGVLMMSHALETNEIVQKAKSMVQFGADAIILMDSAGALLPLDCAQRVEALLENFQIEVGMHAHNNLGMAISNATIAASAGAKIIDGASMGLGAGAGNAQIEAIIGVFAKMGLTTKLVSDFYPGSQLVENNLSQFLPRTSASSIMSGLSGVFSGYAPFVEELALKYGVSLSELWYEIGKSRLVPGQESILAEIAERFSKK